MECREAWPGSCGAKARLVALSHHPIAAAARGPCQQCPHLGDLVGSTLESSTGGGSRAIPLPPTGRKEVSDGGSRSFPLSAASSCPWKP